MGVNIWEGSKANRVAESLAEIATNGIGTTNYNELSNKPQIGGTALTGNKSLHDLGIAAESDIPDVTGKTDKVQNATSGDFAALDSNGNLTDSGKKAEDFATPADVNAKYTKPGGGIPSSDLASGVQTSLDKADSAYQKPGAGIPSSDMASAVQTSLGKADTAYQKPGGGIPRTDLASGVQTSLGKADSAYQKPGGGIPASDLASGVLTSIIDDAAGEGDTNKVWSADKTERLNNSVNGEITPYATDCPVNITDKIGQDAVLSFTTATSYFVTNKNLCDIGTDTFTRSKTYNLPFELQPGDYTFSAGIESDDTDSQYCVVQLWKDSSAITTSNVLRGDRISVHISPDSSFNKVLLMASNSYTHAEGDVATFTNVQIESGQTSTPYISYDGAVHSVDGIDQMQINYSPTIIMTNDLSDVEVSIANGGLKQSVALLSIREDQISQEFNGEQFLYGTGCPLIVENLVGSEIELSFTTATSCFMSNKNLCDFGTKEIGRSGSYSLPFELPAGSYVFSADVVSDDTDSQYCTVQLWKDSSVVVWGSIQRGTRKSTRLVADSSFNKVLLMPSDSYLHSEGDTATFTNIQIEIGETSSAYIEYDGEVLDTRNMHKIDIDVSPTVLITNDFSNINAYTSADGIKKKVQMLSPLIMTASQNDVGKAIVVKTVNGDTVTEYELQNASTMSDKKMLVFGDSIWGNDRTNGVSDFLADYSGLTIYNCAIGGTWICGDRSTYSGAPAWRAFDGVNLIHAKLTNTWTDQDEYVDQVTSYAPTVLALLKTVDMSSIDIVVLSYGTNDFSNNKTISAITGAYETVINELLTSYPKLRILICTPAWRMFSGEDGDTHVNSNNNTTKDMVDGIVTMAKANHVAVINMFEELPWRGLTKTYYLDSDYVHPNTDGNKIYAHVVNGKLRSMY